MIRLGSVAMASVDESKTARSENDRQWQHIAVQAALPDEVIALLEFLWACGKIVTRSIIRTKLE